MVQKQKSGKKANKRKKRKSKPINTSGPWKVSEYARYRRVSRPTVYSWISKGLLDANKIGGSRVIEPEHHAAFLSQFQDS